MNESSPEFIARLIGTDEVELIEGDFQGAFDPEDYEDGPDEGEDETEFVES
jgi:hypothetical protein